MSLPLLRKHTDGVIAKLETLTFPIGDAVAPASVPCAVVYDIPGGRSYGTLENPNEDADLVYQVTCVGETREQASWVADKVIDALLPGFTVADRHIARVTIDSFPSVRRDESASPHVFIATPRFRVISTPE